MRKYILVLPLIALVGSAQVIDLTIRAGTTNPTASNKAELQATSDTGGSIACRLHDGSDCLGYTFFESSLSTPATAPTITHAGTGGSSTWGYVVVFSRVNGPSGTAALGVLSNEGQTTTGNATLTSSNYNIVAPVACPAGTISFDVYRSTSPNSGLGGLGIGLIGTSQTCGTAFHDTGLSASYFENFAPFIDFSSGIYLSKPIVDTANGFFGYAAGPGSADLTGLPALGVFTKTSDPNYETTFVSNTGIDQGSTAPGNQFVMSLTAAVTPFAPLVPFEVIGADNGFTSFDNNWYNNVSHFDFSAHKQEVIGYLTQLNTPGGATDLEGVVIDSNPGTSVTDDEVGYMMHTPSSGSVTHIYAFRSQQLHTIGDAHPIWFEDDGPYKIDSINTYNSVYQSRPAQCNPQVGCTVGGSNYEWGVCQWESNTFVCKTEAGGSGTLRPFKIDGAEFDFGSSAVTWAITGQRYLCITTAGKVVSSPSACSGT